MRVLSVFGPSQSGKTTTLEHLIAELTHRGYSIGSVKDIHFEAFTIDTSGSNTDRHRKAGSKLVTARGLAETDILHPVRLTLPQILQSYSQDFVLCEGVTDYNVPKIITGQSQDDLEHYWQDGIVAVSGKIAASLKTYRQVPALSALDDIGTLADLVEQKALPLLPDVDPRCCQVCGLTCREFRDAVLRDEKKLSQCVQFAKPVEVYVNDTPIDLVPFVQDIIRSTVTGLVGQLRGYQDKASLRIEIKGSADEYPSQD